MVSPILSVKGLEFAYNGKPVLDGVDLKIMPGELLAICGPNGSGKTTLLKCLNGELKPRKGHAVLGGRPLSGMRPARIAQHLAMVPQESHFEFDFTVEEVVEMGRTPYRGIFMFSDRGGRTVVDRSMREARVWELRGKSINRLSGGEKQRVVLARALAQEPDILLLDEPLSNLDLRHSFETLELLLRLDREKGLTMVMVIHDLDTAMAHADRVALLHRGKIAAIGAPKVVLTPGNIRRVFGVEVQVTGGGIRVLGHAPVGLSN